MTKEEILKGESYVVDCYIQYSEKDRKKAQPLFIDKGDGIVRARLENYAIIPMDVYNELKSVSQRSELLAFEDWVNKNTTTALKDGIKLALENYKKANCG
jgi:hypothetical protein